MRSILLALALVLSTGAGALAHEGNDHVRGVIVKITPENNTLVVRTDPNTVRSLSLTEKTAFKKSGKVAHLADLNVGDRVVIDVPAKTAQAVLIQIGEGAATHK
jgi:uncharacterized protein with PIN domain